MSDFLVKVNKVVKNMDEYPYDDKKTIDILSEETKKTLELYVQLRKSKVEKN